MTFFFHYNKPQTQKAGKPQISVHFKGQCLIVDNVVVNVPTKGKLRKTQPRFIMAGKCESIDVRDNIAYID